MRPSKRGRIPGKRAAAWCRDSGTGNGSPLPLSRQETTTLSVAGGCSLGSHPRLLFCAAAAAQTAAEPTAPPSVALATTPAFGSHDWTRFSGSLYLVGRQVGKSQL